MDLSVYLHQAVRGFSRYNKYTLGSDLRTISLEIVRLIIRANNTAQKEAVLRELVQQCEMLKAMLVVAKEVKAFQHFKSFQHASALAVMLCRQSEGWLKSSLKSQNHPSAARPRR